jgi:phosphoserine phosphatase RsbU/P
MEPSEKAPMRVLVADDERVSRRMLETILTEWGYDVQTVSDGLAAWEVLRREDAPPLAILDWLMPELDGPEICRRVRALPTPQPPHLVLLTVKGRREDVVAGLEAGASDYLTKPFDLGELRARLQVGSSIVGLRRSLADRVRELEEAMARVKQLQGLLPICAYCKNIRDDGDYWHKVETYLAEHTSARFTHSICPGCWDTVVRPEFARAGVELPCPASQASTGGGCGDEKRVS